MTKPAVEFEISDNELRLVYGRALEFVFDGVIRAFAAVNGLFARLVAR